MGSPFDKNLTSSGAIGSDGKVTNQEKQKFAASVEKILRNGSTLPGLEFSPDPFAEETVKRLKSSETWNKTYVDGLLGPTLKSLDTTGNVPLFPVHDLSSTFNVDLDLNDLLDPTNFTPDKLVVKSGLTLPEVTNKIQEITSNINIPIPQIPTPPTPDSVLKTFGIEKSSLSDLNTGTSEINGKIEVLTKDPMVFFGKLLTTPIDLFKELLSTPDETLAAAVDGSLLQKILQKILNIVKIVIAALGAAIGAVYVLVATILAWVYKIVTAIASSVVSAIIGTGSISASIYNAQVD